MKLFQQLLVAPAALGLMAPMAANAADLNISGMSGYSDSASQAYSSSDEQVTSITQFSDVYPTDWAYQALSNLIERYGCVAGYPSGSYKGNRAMTRYEAAALLNACLDRITEVTDELRRLLKEFETELSVLRGRVDGLEARVGELEATQFSTTTKLTGQAIFVVGANSYSGNSQYDSGDKKYTSENYSTLAGATAFNYDYRLDLDTSFTGKDLLKTRLRASNFGSSPWGATPLNWLEFGVFPTGDNLAVNRLYYQFPVGEEFTATFGAMVRQDNMLAVWPSAYPTDTVLDFFSYAGAPGNYPLQTGGGAGIWWSDNDSGWSISASYLSLNAENGSPDGTLYEGNLADGAGGIANDASMDNGNLQVAYTGDSWGLAASYNYANPQNGGGLYGGNATPMALDMEQTGVTNSFSLSGYWMPENTGWIPSVSAGWGLNKNSPRDKGNFVTADVDLLDSSTSQSWYVGLQWEDAFSEGNVLGMAVGQPTFVTEIDFTEDFKKTSGYDNFVADGNYALELWYMFQVTDNITVTPAVFYLSRPNGDYTNVFNGKGNKTLSNTGALVKTTFKF